MTLKSTSATKRAKEQLSRCDSDKDSEVRTYVCHSSVCYICFSSMLIVPF